MQGTPTKLSLSRWAEIMGYSPLHFWGVNLDQYSRGGLTCSTPLLQYDWQTSDRVGREQIAQAIAEAEADLESFIGYRLAPSWEVDEWVPVPTPYQRGAFNLNGRDLRGLNVVLEPKWGHFISGGIRSADVLGTSKPIVWANDGKPPAAYLNIGTVVLSGVAVEYPDCEIQVYYAGHADEDRYRIRPVEVTHVADAGTFEYTIKFRRELAVAEDNIESYDLSTLRGVDGMDDAAFIEAVDVVRVYNDPQQQATLLWEGTTTCGCGQSGGPCPQCGYATQGACLLVRGDPRMSMVAFQPGAWDQDTLSFMAAPFVSSRAPDIARLWYYSGLRDRSQPCRQEMDPDWERVVAYFAASKLDRPACACGKTQWEYWAADLAFAGGSEEKATYNLTQSQGGNPFGTKRGALNAWRRVDRRGAVVGRVATD